MSVITGNFTGQLLGPLLLVLEEPQAFSKKNADELTNALKHKITHDELRVKIEYKPAYNVKNFLSIIIFSNNNALNIKDGERRTNMLDTSSRYKGNHKYFSDLVKNMMDDEVGHAFYCHMIEHYQKNRKWNTAIMPTTTNKSEIIQEHLHPLFKYIKTRFLARQKGINMPFREFYNKFIQSAPLKCHTSEISTSKMLKEIGITLEKRGVKTEEGKNTTVNFVSKPYLELLKIYQRKKWIHETDEIETKDEYDPVDEPIEIEANDSDSEVLIKRTTRREVNITENILLIDERKKKEKKKKPKRTKQQDSEHKLNEEIHCKDDEEYIDVIKRLAKIKK